MEIGPERMSDNVDQSTRSRMMSGIRGKDTKPERVVRSGLHRRGLRFRLQRRDLPGRPDLVLTRFRAAVFVHGCFWHRHGGCRYTASPATREDFWTEKFRRNIQRDRAVQGQLRQLGWRVFVVWECGLRHAPEQTIDELAMCIKETKTHDVIEIPLAPPVIGTFTDDRCFR